MMETSLMKRVLLSGAGLALLLGVTGCGSAGIDEGMPSGDLKPTVKMDPSMTDPSGRFGAGAAAKSKTKSQNAAAEAAKAGGGAEEK
jgi:hypothetical protein